MPDAKKILISHNDPATLRLISSALSGLSCQVETAHGTHDALRHVREQAYDLVVTILQPEGEEDVELLRQMRRVRPRLKLMVLTEDSTPGAVIDSLREHAFSFFSKPFSPGAIAHMVDQALAFPSWDDGIEVLSACPDWITLKMHCRNLTADRVMQFMRELTTDLTDQERQNVGMAFREILLNAIEHGAGQDPLKWIHVSFVRTRHMIIYYVRDPGEGFSFSALPQAAISNPVGDPVHHLAYRAMHGIRPGGFGILMAQELADELIYNEKGNEVLLIKYLSGTRSALHPEALPGGG
jgi:CheY-like chemotaxis protein/anti-sigma regulatory factor (Ser/Thr protein kinase)